ncbi:hypothetical protein PHMEG_00021125 [Phytophthora megakarya]|uniref:Reverse transcriptase n=1 Tax=Phytophthora megakarya TaxID=4795 RepID=A0A225VPY3_9STRA|nr:hypothetical protein PHMEG_00021125 [Phytophthora megakarya]
MAVYAKGRDETLLQKEKELYEYWLAEKPPAVERQAYTRPARILTRPTEDSVAPRKSVLGYPESDDRDDGVRSLNSVKILDGSEASIAAGVDEGASGEPDPQPTEYSDVGDDEIDPAEDSVDMLELTYISVMQEIEAEIAAGDKDTDGDWYEHIPNEIELADYAHELAFLTGMIEPSSTVLDYTGPNIMNESLDEDEQRKLVEVLQHHEEIMIASGNALPPQHSERQPMASPIMIVLKKNGVDIRLCIDYKGVNAVTTIMEYAMDRGGTEGNADGQTDRLRSYYL